MEMIPTRNVDLQFVEATASQALTELLCLEANVIAPLRF
jgi:hypothetical protein